MVELSNGTTIKEPAAGGSIKAVPSGAQVLYILGVDGTPQLKVALIVDGVPFRPIFYRKKERGIARNSTVTRATVFGRGRESGSLVHVTLWASIQGRVVDCPAQYQDPAMIELQVLQVQ